MTAEERAWQITAMWADGTNDSLRSLIVQHIKVVKTQAVAEERERCAKVAELYDCLMGWNITLTEREVQIVDKALTTIPKGIAAAIRKVKP